MTDNDDTWPRRFSLTDRASMTFKSFLVSRFGSRFYQDEFLNGLAARRIEMNAKVARTFSACFASTTLLAFFDLVSGKLQIGTLAINLSTDVTPLIAFAVAGNFFCGHSRVP